MKRALLAPLAVVLQLRSQARQRPRRLRYRACSSLQPLASLAPAPAPYRTQDMAVQPGRRGAGTVNMHWTTWNRMMVAGGQPFNAAIGTGVLRAEGNQNQIKAYNVSLQASYPVYYLGHYVFAVVCIFPMSPGAPSWIVASPAVDL